MGVINLLEQGICQHYDQLAAADWDVMYQIFVRDGKLIVIPMNFMNEVVIRAQFNRGNLSVHDRTKLAKCLKHEDILEQLELPKRNIEDYCIIMYVTHSTNNDFLYMVTYKKSD